MSYVGSLRSLRRTALLLACPLLTSACGSPNDGAGVPRSAADSQAAHVADVVAQGGIVDSILPMAEHLRRFRATVISHADTLAHASPSIDALTARWARAVSTSDTAALNAMVLDRSEFAWLYFADSPMAKPPYEAPPELLWGQIMTSSDQGAQRMQNRHGGKPLEVAGVECPAPAPEGANRVYQNCTATLRSGSKPLPATRYFGSIIERDGRFKFISLANRL